MKTHLIHLLGGKTAQECQQSDNETFLLGQWSALNDLKTYADSINGINADDWCKALYNRILTAMSDTDARMLGKDLPPSPPLQDEE